MSARLRADFAHVVGVRLRHERTVLVRIAEVRSILISRLLLEVFIVLDDFRHVHVTFGKVHALQFGFYLRKFADRRAQRGRHLKRRIHVFVQKTHLVVLLVVCKRDILLVCLVHLQHRAHAELICVLDKSLRHGISVPFYGIVSRFEFRLYIGLAHTRRKLYGRTQFCDLPFGADFVFTAVAVHVFAAHHLGVRACRYNIALLEVLHCVFGLFRCHNKCIGYGRSQIGHVIARIVCFQNHVFYRKDFFAYGVACKKQCPIQHLYFARKLNAVHADTACGAVAFYEILHHNAIFTHYKGCRKSGMHPLAHEVVVSVYKRLSEHGALFQRSVFHIHGAHVAAEITRRRNLFLLRHVVIFEGHESRGVFAVCIAHKVAVCKVLIHFIAYYNRIRHGR